MGYSRWRRSRWVDVHLALVVPWLVMFAWSGVGRISLPWMESIAELRENERFANEGGAVED